MAPPLLSLIDVRKAFGAVQALKGVSFDLRAGEVHALVGENGAGKSTLVKLITGAERLDQGRIEFSGQDAGHLLPERARQLGVVAIYQQPALFPELSVAENIDLRLERPTLLRLINRKARRARASRLLEQIGANLGPDLLVNQLSMPEQQLVEIACAVGSGARIIIMDEPTASLTRKEQDLLFAVISDLRQQGAGILYISHRLDEVFALANRVTVLRDGESVGTQPADALSEASLIRLMVGREVAHLYPAGNGLRGNVVLSLRDVSCAASGLRQISLDLCAGEILGLAGLVGAGRTELARVLFGITPADAGQILLAGQRVTIKSPAEAVALGIAYVPEDRSRHGIVLELPISHNITMAIQPRIFPHGWLRLRAERELALRFINELGVKASGPEAPANSLSGGNQQKVAVARWLATNPKLLILDEPTQGVDVGAKSQLHGIIRDLAQQGLAVLLISSDLPEVLGMSDRIGVMRGGALEALFPAKTAADEVMAAAFGRKRDPGADGLH